jgi:hypothetical protein
MFPKPSFSSGMDWLDDQLQNEKHIHSRREFLVDVEATARRNPMGMLLAAFGLGAIVAMTLPSR